MGGLGDNRLFRGMVVGDLDDRFVRYAANLLCEFGVDCLECDDVYSAVAELSKTEELSDVLVIGRFEQLSREDGRFFEIVAQKGFKCCYLTDEVHKQKKICQWRHGDVFVVGEYHELDAILTKLISRNWSSSKVRGDNGPNFNREEFAATKAELDALLGE